MLSRDGLPILPLLLFLGSIVALALTRVRYVPGRAFALFRALFPSWRFFEDLSHVPRLSCRTGEGPWFECLRPHARGVGAVVLNSRGNLRHACNSLVEETVSDLAELWEKGEEVSQARMDQFSHCVSYRLTEELSRYQLKNVHGFSPGTAFQFKISVQSDETSDPLLEDVLVSLVHEV
jgi:hypothetical protein